MLKTAEATPEQVLDQIKELPRPNTVTEFIRFLAEVHKLDEQLQQVVFLKLLRSAVKHYSALSETTEHEKEILCYHLDRIERATEHPKFTLTEEFKESRYGTPLVRDLFLKIQLSLKHWHETDDLREAYTWEFNPTRN